MIIIILKFENKTRTKTPIDMHNTANVDLLKMVPVEILLNLWNYFRTLQLGFWKFLSGIVFLHHYVRTIGLFFSQAHSIWPKPRAFNPDRKSMGTPTIYCDNMKKRYREIYIYIERERKREGERERNNIEMYTHLFVKWNKQIKL